MAAHLGHEREPGPQDLLINLGDRPPKVQRQELLNMYVRQRIMERRERKGTFSADPLEDIAAMRKFALEGTIREITSRLDGFWPQAYSVAPEDPNFDPGKVFEQIDDRNKAYRYPSTYDSLLITTIPEAKLTDVLLHGKPSGGIALTLDPYESQAMKEYALAEESDVIRATAYVRSDPAVRVKAGHALLVYAPDCLQRIVPQAPGYEEHADNFYAFIDSGLTKIALQAYVTREGFDWFPMAAEIPEPVRVGEKALAGAGLGQGA